MSGARGRAAGLAAAPGLLAALCATQDTLVWLAIVAVACGVTLRLTAAFVASPPPRTPGERGVETALLAGLAGSLLYAVAWAGRLPLQLGPGEKRPLHLIAAALAAGCAWALLRPRSGVEPAPAAAEPEA
ncbi:MAG: hypothetical protein KDD82_23670 [Planctomycetes bacterium]|nr:hypothetical protein [Planctomycetota bacterium]